MAIFLARKFLSVTCWGPKRGAQLVALSRGVVDGLTGRYSLGYLPEGAYPPGSEGRETDRWTKIAAVVTAYHPDERLAAVVESALRAAIRS